MKLKRISIVTLGCSKNEIDSELMMSILKDNNYIKAESLDEAEIIIVNTCGFIDKAKEESIETIWEMTKYKDEGNCKYLILAGCLAERYSQELMDEITDIDAIIGTGNIKEISSIIDEIEIKKERIKKIGSINTNYLEEVTRINFNTTEYVRISEGCDNFCTYCIIPKLRGKHRSRKIEDIVKEVKSLANNGTKEIILIGQNTSDYGIDLYGEYSLYKLLNQLNNINGISWIRVLYLYPDNFNDKLIQSMKDNEKVLKYVDIPLQHINNNVLKRMNRRTCKEDIGILINKLRHEIPDIVIRTTFIVGFPGETEEEFDELYNFIKDIEFDRLGVFTYSKEEDTPAYNLPNQIEDEIKEIRKDKIMILQQELSEKIMTNKVGKIFDVLIEELSEENLYIGRTYMDSPDIDGVVYVNSSQDIELGSFIKVKITDSLEYDLIGEAIK
ncbi:30S ribosomal protein S12 methylthiotransferase RimO [Tissierella pigra]|uniref:Ribosomal protein uS12 methylthiotransferase RimO n=1 Tax=Tissierella pigra TaxID=2607614 RepID=A0A6N7XD61_9FIRM|nr:30S ribosomal protein S12 methylthiotransferase RimO [Tissierella pigra]MBU5426586.1 30S ribosomal protein S12 methylthiotransferase RimO [Tissierella pigra]MST99968.1 30S ribosomal protein S12 methylthiotransferase RimO [Tissierella pigra]